MIEGWRGIRGALKAHYVKAGQSLCGRWGTALQELTEQNTWPLVRIPTDPGACLACNRLRMRAILLGAPQGKEAR